MRTSVIIPCYNTGQFIADAIRSAWGQSQVPHEVIVVDDGSSDESAEVAEALGARVFRQDNAGVSQARNVGLAESEGDFILFLDADDRLLPTAIETHLACFGQCPEAAMVYGSNYIIGPQGDNIGTNAQAPCVYSWREVMFGVVPTSSQAMFRREAVVLAGGFDSRVHFGEDFDLYLRLCAEGIGVCHGEFVTDYRKHPGQATRRPAASLESMLGVVDRFAERHSVDGPTLALARRHWRIYYGQWILNEAIKSVVRKDLTRAKDSTLTYLRHCPDTLIGTVRQAFKFLRR
ncbi:MAG TPA: glycosyltransferase family A protein [Caulobacteraceae bacterium]|jgi:glycosyltransferase involved in cell wall biosynthesis